ncbi:MAG: hypothetical protein HY721_04950 [Planctomycetes bacterium]|nr:hypothetical protein [Planctomycetota bacterium]
MALLTKDKRLPEAEREARYHEALASAPRPVRLIKIADAVDNLCDAPHGGDRQKALAKARRLLEIYAGDASIERALEVLRGEVEGGTGA